MDSDDDCLIVKEDIKSPAVKKPQVKPLMKTKQACLSFVRLPGKSPRDSHVTTAIASKGKGTKPRSVSPAKIRKKRQRSGPSTQADQPKPKKAGRVAPIRRKCASPDEDENKLDPLNKKCKPVTEEEKIGSASLSLLQKFVCKKPTHQDEVSTSDETCKGKDNCELNCELNSERHGNDSAIDVAGDDEDIKSPAKEDSSDSNGAAEDEMCTQVNDSEAAKSGRKSVLEVIESVVNRGGRASVKTRDNNNDAFEDELTKSNKRKISSDSNKSPSSEKENCAKPPSPKRSRNVLTAFIQMGGKKSHKGASSTLQDTSPDSVAESKSSTSADKEKVMANADQPVETNTAKEEVEDSNRTHPEVIKPTSVNSTMLKYFSKKSSESDLAVPAKAKNKSKSPTCMEKESTAASMSKKNSANESSSASLPEDSDEPASPSRPKNVVGTQADATSRKMITPARKTVQDNEGCAEAGTPKTCKNKLTPKAAAKLAEKKLREEQRLKEHEEKLKEKAKKVAERLKLKEEKRMEIEKQRLEKEEQKKKKQEEQEIKNREKEEKRKKVEEEKRAKEEDKRSREEEKKKAEQEEEDRKKKVAEKFANFFKTGKEEPAQKTVEARDNSGPFQQMQVSRNTALAPTQRTRLSDDARAFLDELLGATPGDALTTYLDALRSGEHKPMTCAATPPAVIIQDSKDDCVIIEQEPEDDDDEDGSDFASEDMVVCREKNIKDAKNHRGKLLKFCENRRPAYWGTWTKKPAAVGPRKPFAKEEIFDYEYDSDDDWEEEEENGESLSDSEGEKEDGEDEQYEVDNDFFVPHGYLSDDEGQDDKLDGSEDNTAEEDGAHNDAPALIDNKEKLKAKQAEFEKELKKQTKQLKPRVLGCLWLHEEEQSSGAAFDHLHRVLSGYSVVICTPPPSPPAASDSTEPPATSTPAETSVTDKEAAVERMHSWYLTLPGIPCVALGSPQPEQHSASDVDTPLTATTGASKLNFRKTFPEEAIPSLIRLIHGNRHSQRYLVEEFYQFWQLKMQDSAASDNQHSSTPNSSRLQGSNVLSKMKIKAKIALLGCYKKCPEEGPFSHRAMWYVNADVRQQYGLQDLALPNEWIYCTGKPKDNRLKEDSICGDSPTSVRTTNLISKFTKVLTDQEKSALVASKSSNGIMTPDNSISKGSSQVLGGLSPNDVDHAKKEKNVSATIDKKSRKKSGVGKSTATESEKLSKTTSPKNSPLLAFFKTPQRSASKKTPVTGLPTEGAKGGKSTICIEDDDCITLD